LPIRYDVRLAGVGGQGLILAGMILGEAASIFGSLNAVQTQSYAPLVRGAPSMSEVVISDQAIDFPMVEEADILLALVQDAFDEYAAAVRPGGTIIVEESAVDTSAVSAGWSADSEVRAANSDARGAGSNARPRLVPLPLARTATECGAPSIAATIVALGAVARLTGLIEDEAMRQAVRLRVPRDSRERNLAALEAGFSLAEGIPTI